MTSLPGIIDRRRWAISVFGIAACEDDGGRASLLFGIDVGCAGETSAGASFNPIPAARANAALAAGFYSPFHSPTNKLAAGRKV
jgi:hypothetical protein